MKFLGEAFGGWLTMVMMSPFGMICGLVIDPFVDTGGKIYLYLFSFFLDTDPHLASVVCDLYLFSVSRYELCVCVGTCVYMCM